MQMAPQALAIGTLHRFFPRPTSTGLSSLRARRKLVLTPPRSSLTHSFTCAFVNLFLSPPPKMLPGCGADHAGLCPWVSGGPTGESHTPRAHFTEEETGSKRRLAENHTAGRSVFISVPRTG